MFKEIKDVKGVCKDIVSRMDKIKNLCIKIDGIMEEIESRASQEEAVNLKLVIRKELAKLFILNSNIEDNFDALKKVFDSLKKRVFGSSDKRRHT
jgi:hypothetical protein